MQKGIDLTKQYLKYSVSIIIICILCLSFQQTYCNEPGNDRVEIFYQDTFSDHNFIRYLRMKFQDKHLILYCWKQVCIYDINSNKKLCKKIKNKMNPINDVFIYKDRVIILRDTTSEYYKLNNNKFKRIKTFRFYERKTPLYFRCLTIICKIILRFVPDPGDDYLLLFNSKGLIYNNDYYVFRDGYEDHDYIYKINLENYKVKKREINEIVDFEEIKRQDSCKSLFGSFYFIGENILYSDNYNINLFSIKDLENNFSLEKYNDVISLSINDEISMEKDINRFRIPEIKEINGNYYVLFECETNKSSPSYYLLLNIRKKEFTFLFDEDKIRDYFTKAYLKDKYIILKSKRRKDKKGNYETEIIDLENNMKYKFEKNIFIDGVINNKFLFFNKKEKKIIVYDNIKNKEYEIKFPEEINELRILKIIVKNNMAYILGEEEIEDKYYYKLFVLKLNI